ncbi:MAG: 2Fe-2S iron-sulfur cluster-binding protein [Alphaproteobacteria bacterium]|jgi:hypothetical protein|nr:2Fe-2S iron-sulfur cluster-binding protein [Alphaproteobacteria bacterium]MDP6517878.1 2Fe-2S iron-sulfur cluster-binding protein [Alphaproteobacteria bacterium]
MTDVINYAGVAFLLALMAYVLALFYRTLSQDRIARESVAMEGRRLRTQMDAIMAERRFVRDLKELSWNGWRKFEVASKVPETSDICSFYLRPHDGRPLPPFQPGQFLTFQLHLPDQRKPVVRCYSLSDGPGIPEHYRVSIKRVPPPRDKPDVPPGLASNYFHGQLNQGDILDIKAPGGAFYLDMTKQTPVVLIGGGIGVTPVLSMLNAIVSSGSKRETWFFYGLRNKTEHVLKEHLEQVAKENENVHLQICYSKPDDGDIKGEDYDHAARVSVDLFKEVLPSNNYEYYMCGPPPFMTSITEGLAEWGVPDRDVNFEAFGPASAKKAGPPAAAAEAGAGAAITVSFAKSGASLAWSADAGSLLDFAEDNDIQIESGCRAGSCGTCVIAIMSGEVTYLHEPGEAPDAGSCLTCIAVPKGDISLDA